VPESRAEAAPQPPPSAGRNADFGRDPRVENIVAVVIAIRERPYGELIISLDNGHVWEQKHVDRRFRLKVGDTVTIARGAVSGYRLSGSGNRSIQVKRRN
jgi:hypothetical protein